MFTSTTTSTEYSNSILDFPPIRPILMDRTRANWNCTNKIEVAPNCPRCASSNTKFCYYNNYSLSQPRYFCKGCRRYWTKGGSLRNVPVGGGCRKSRRSRSAGQGRSASYADPMLSPVGSGSESEGAATCIDMAAVFAKYVNQNVGSNEDSFSPGSGISSGSSDNVQGNSLEIDSQLEDISMFEYQKQMDLINGGDDNQMKQVHPHELSTHQEINGQDFVYYQDCNGFELMQQGIVGDDQLAADHHMLWSESTDLLSFESQQPMVQEQDFGLFSPDDQFRISTNLVTDNWGSFDLSAYEVFSTP